MVPIYLSLQGNITSFVGDEFVEILDNILGSIKKNRGLAILSISQPHMHRIRSIFGGIVAIG